MKDTKHELENKQSQEAALENTWIGELLCCAVKWSRGLELRSQGSVAWKEFEI